MTSNKTFCKADFAYFTLAQFWINFSIRRKSKNEKNEWFLSCKKDERDYYAKLRILHIMIVSELLKIQKLCARHYVCARHRGRARIVWCTHLNFANCLVEITKMCPETLLCMVTHATNFEWVFFHQWCQNVLLSTHISPC